MHDGRTVRGRLAGSDENTATVVEKTGQVISIAIIDATNLTETTPPVPTPPPTLEARDAPRVAMLERDFGDRYSKPKGKKMHTAGSVVLSLGITQAVLGVGFGVVAAISGDELFGATSIGLLLGGGVTIAVGAPLYVKGKKRRLEYYRWLHQQSLAARISPGFLAVRGGGGPSIRIAF